MKRQILIILSILLAIAACNDNIANAFGGRICVRIGWRFKCCKYYQCAPNYYCAPCQQQQQQCPTGQCPTGQCPTGQCPTGQCPTGQCPIDPISEAVGAGLYNPDNPIGTAEATDAALNALNELERELISEANRVRGRFVLKFDSTVNSRSQYNTKCQSAYCRLGHFSGDSNEIAGVGYTSARAAINGWLNSPAHRAILLRGNYKRVGACVRRGRDGRLYWTMNFSY